RCQTRGANILRLTEYIRAQSIHIWYVAFLRFCLGGRRGSYNRSHESRFKKVSARLTRSKVRHKAISCLEFLERLLSIEPAAATPNARHHRAAGEHSN